MLQAIGNAVDDLFADARDGQQDEQHARKKHDSERGLPWDMHPEADGVGKVRIQ